MAFILRFSQKFFLFIYNVKNVNSYYLEHNVNRQLVTK